MKPTIRPRRIASAGAAALAGALVLFSTQCQRPARTADVPTRSGAEEAAEGNDWNVVYAVLQHPRCMNCHPSGDAPLQGDDRHEHVQFVRRGPDGSGLYAMRCATCHQTRNLTGAHLPPGAPNWHLPKPEQPLVFQGKTPGELCRQLRDPTTNGGHTMEEIFTHVAEDPLVGWGWDPGAGRTPVSIPRARVVAALRAWIDGGCDCPE